MILKPWSCLIDAFDVVMGIDLEKYLSDPGEIIWPEHKEPFNRRGTHIQEIIYLGYKLGFLIVEFETKPIMAPFDDFPDKFYSVGTFKPPFENNGVIIGTNHAIAWKDGTLIDPIFGNLGAVLRMEMEAFFAVFRFSNSSQKAKSNQK